jgi:hypothetical protein
MWIWFSFKAALRVQSLIAGGVQLLSVGRIIAARTAGPIRQSGNEQSHSIVADKRIGRFEDLKGGKAAISRRHHVGSCHAPCL